MAILTGFPPGGRQPSTFGRISCFVRIGPNDYSQESPYCPKFAENLYKQNERARAALVFYALNVMNEQKIESTTELMKKCIDVGQAARSFYEFSKHGPYGEYIQGHLLRALHEKDYHTKVISRMIFG